MVTYGPAFASASMGNIVGSEEGDMDEHEVQRRGRPAQRPIRVVIESPRGAAITWLKPAACDHHRLIEITSGGDAPDGGTQTSLFKQLTFQEYVCLLDQASFGFVHTRNRLGCRKDFNGLRAFEPVSAFVFFGMGAACLSRVR